MKTLAECLLRRKELQDKLEGLETIKIIRADGSVEWL